jgi:hypothetical protein
VFSPSSFANRNLDDFFYLAAILRLSTKYCIPHLRKQAIQHLSQTWSDNVQGHDQMVETALNSPPVNDMSYPYAHPLLVLNLARETHVQMVVPSATYFLSLYQLKDILKGDHPKLQVEHPSKPSTDLDYMDLKAYTLMCQKRLEILLDFVRRVVASQAPPDTCIHSTKCKSAFSKLSSRFSRSLRQGTGPLYWMKQAIQEASCDESPLCTFCKKEFRASVEKEREEAWKLLPVSIGMAPWEDLRRSDLEE